MVVATTLEGLRKFTIVPPVRIIHLLSARSVGGMRVMMMLSARLPVVLMIANNHLIWHLVGVWLDCL